jgi:hypothetical protein
MTKDTCAQMPVVRCKHAPELAHDGNYRCKHPLNQELETLKVEQKQALDDRRSKKDMPPQLSSKGYFSEAAPLAITGCTFTTESSTCCAPMP